MFYKDHGASYYETLVNIKPEMQKDRPLEDYFGRPLNIGDTVLYPGAHSKNGYSVGILDEVRWFEAFEYEPYNANKPRDQKRVRTLIGYNGQPIIKLAFKRGGIHKMYRRQPDGSYAYVDEDFGPIRIVYNRYPLYRSSKSLIWLDPNHEKVKNAFIPE